MFLVRVLRRGLTKTSVGKVIFARTWSISAGMCSVSVEQTVSIMMKGSGV